MFNESGTLKHNEPYESSENSNLSKILFKSKSIILTKFFGVFFVSSLKPI